METKTSFACSLMSTIIGYYTNIVGPYGMRYLLDTDLNQVWGHYTPRPHQVK